MVGAAPVGVKPGPRPGASVRRPQIGLVSTSRMNAAPLSQHSSASSGEPVAPTGPTMTTQSDEPEDQRRAGLGEPEQDLEDEVAHRGPSA